MSNIKKILLPVDFPNASLPVIHQAAALARHFQAEIALLHVVTTLSRASGAPGDASRLSDWDLLVEILKQADANLDHGLAQELAGLTIHRLLAKGDPARAIMRTAHEEKTDLIMMPSNSHVFHDFLLGSVTAKLLGATECPVWTGPQRQELQPPKYEIRNILCAVDYRSHLHKAISWAERLALAFGARLTLASVTAGSVAWGPGGNYTNRRWNEALLADAGRHVAELQRSMTIKAEVFIGSGDLAKVLSQAARETNADVLITGCRPCGAHLRTHGYPIIREVPIPVLCVGGS